MKIIKPSIEIIDFDAEKILRNIEKAGRTCYKSEDRITDESAKAFVKMLLKRNHTAMVEFGNIIVKVVCDRGVTHEIVRHRIFSYAQESTRYCNYSKDKFGNELTFIKPYFWENDTYIPEGANPIDFVTEDDYLNETRYWLWHNLCAESEKAYLKLIESGQLHKKHVQYYQTHLKQK